MIIYENVIMLSGGLTWYFDVEPFTYVYLCQLIMMNLSITQIRCIADTHVLLHVFATRTPVALFATDEHANNCDT